MTQLNGSSDRIALGPDIFVQAPGLTGTVELLEPSLLGTRAGEERATPALTSALDRQQFMTVHSLEIFAQPAMGPAAPPTRGADDRPLLALEVPEIGSGQPQVVLLADEEGVVTWHFAQPAARPNTVRFEVPADTVTAPTAGPAGTERGLVWLIGKKLLSVLVFPALEVGAKILAQQLARNWEDAHRRPCLRRFSGPADGTTVRPLDGPAWDSLRSGPALLFIHGTCSTSNGGFGSLDHDVWAQLENNYQGRVFAYDHPTLSVDPAANADRLAALVPTGPPIDVDIVAHSRGGLVARELACAGADDSFPLRVRKIVHVGVPNAGTALADVERHGQFIDRITTMLNLAPDGPLSVVADVLDGVLTVVKIVACNGIGALPGLHAMDPANNWLSTLGGRAARPFTGYAIEADYEPAGALLKLVRLSDGVVDKVFGGTANDIVVPTGGVYDAGAAFGFPIPPHRRLSFDKNENVWHCGYFSQRKTGEALLRWLTGASEWTTTA